jgi:RNA polymerase sigma-70 factor (ECF subfamily)
MDSMPPPDLDALLRDTSFVRRLALALVRDPDAADDVAQDAMVIALERPPRDERSVRGWIASVVRSRAIERARRASSRTRHEAAAPPPDPVPTPDEIVARMETSRRVAEAVATLEEPYRTVIYLRYVDALEPRAIAQRLDVPVATVKTRLRRGLALLRERLDGEYGTREAWSALLLPLVPSSTSTTVVTGVFAMSAALKIACSLVACAAIAWLVWPERTRRAHETVSTVARPEETQLADPGANSTARAGAGESASAAVPLVAENVPADAHFAVVLDERRFPVAGARVRLHVRGLGDEEAVTGADGRARFALGAKFEPSKQRASLLAWDANGRVAATDCQTRWQAAASIGDTEKRTLGVLVLSVGASLVVRAADDDGPAAGTAILLELGERRAIVFDAVTGSDGRARFERLPALAVTVSASGAGMVGREATVLAAGRETELTVRLVSARRVDVRVVDGETKRPVPNARVSVGESIDVTHDGFDMGVPSGRTFGMTMPFDLEIRPTDDAGRTRIVGLPPRTKCELRAEAEGFRGPQPPAPAARLAADADSITIELTSLHKRQVRWPIERGEVDAPAEGALLAIRTDTVQRLGLEKTPTPPQSARIERGAVVADDVVDGLLLLAIAPDGSIARLWIKAGEAVGTPTSFRRPRTVEVSVQDASGQPAPGIEIALCNSGNNRLLPPVKTDSNGKAVFRSLWGQRAVAQIANRTIGSVDLELGDGLIETRLPNTSSREISVRLLVGGVPGLPAAYQVRAGTGSGMIAEDPATGIVRVKVLPADEAQTVNVSVIAVGYQQASADAPLDGSTIVDIPLAVACRLSAHVTLPPHGKVRIRAERFDPETNDWAMGPDSTVSDERFAPNAPDGRFLFTGLVPGKYRVRDVVSKRVSEGVDLAVAATSEVALDLSDIVRVRGIVELPSGLAPGYARVVIDGEGIAENNWDWLGNRRGLGGQSVGKDGAFEVFVSTSHPVTLRPWHPWLTPDQKYGQYVVRGEADDVRLRLVQGDEVQTDVAGWFEKQAPRALRVYAYAADPSGKPDHEFEAAVVEGIARFSGLPRGTWTLWIDPDRMYAPIILRNVKVGPGITKVEAKPTRGSSIRVRVLHEGKQVPRIYIFARRKGEPTLRRELNSAREELVTLSGFDAGTFEVRISAGMGGPLLEQTIELDGVRDVELELDARKVRD